MSHVCSCVCPVCARSAWLSDQWPTNARSDVDTTVAPTEGATTHALEGTGGHENHDAAALDTFAGTAAAATE